MNRPIKITVQEAAKLMGKSTLFVREAMKRDLINIGAVMRLGDSKKYTFYINPSLLAEQLCVPATAMDSIIRELREGKSA